MNHSLKKRLKKKTVRVKSKIKCDSCSSTRPIKKKKSNSIHHCMHKKKSKKKVLKKIVNVKRKKRKSHSPIVLNLPAPILNLTTPVPVVNLTTPTPVVNLTTPIPVVNLTTPVPIVNVTSSCPEVIVNIPNNEDACVVELRAYLRANIGKEIEVIISGGDGSGGEVPNRMGELESVGEGIFTITTYWGNTKFPVVYSISRIIGIVVH